MLRVNIPNYERPLVFLSSTADTLTREWRVQIAEYLKREYKYHVMLWEDGENFPYAVNSEPTPAEDAVSVVSCSHIYILVIGRRYGTISKKDGKSYTHQEFFKAVESKIPIFVFVLKDIWNAYQIYKQNPDAKFDGIVDSNNVFNLINDVISANYIVHNFDIGHNIIEELQGEFSKLTGSLLRFSKDASWIWCEETTERIEKSASEIWIATPDLYWDVEDIVFRNVVRENIIERCIPYRYIIINNNESKLRFSNMIAYYKKVLNKIPSYLKVKWINENKYPWPSEIAIYNPHKTIEMRAIIVNAMEVRNRDSKYNVELGPNCTRRLFEQYKRLWVSI